MKNRHATKRYCLLLLLLAGWLVGLLPAHADETRPSDAEIRSLIPPLCGHWSMGVFAPRYMEAWVEDLKVRDDRGYWVRIPQGTAGSLGQTVGWDEVGGGGGQTIKSAGAPVAAFVRWQSLTEPQTYRWQFIVPDSMRQAMEKKEPVVWLGKADTSCRNNISIGVAPGGQTIVWINGFGFQSTEVMRGQAEVEPLGPDQGKHEGRYVRLSDKAKQYIKEHGIPYGSWDPPPSSHLVTTTSDENLPPSPAIDLAAHPEGLYQLVGVMETSSAIALYPDGRFEAGIDYGAAYGHATGRWTRKDTTITLTRESKDPPRKRTGQWAVDDLSTLFDRLQLTIDGHCLRTVMMSRDACYLRQ